MYHWDVKCIKCGHTKFTMRIMQYGKYMISVCEDCGEPYLFDMINSEDCKHFKHKAILFRKFIRRGE